jgi:chitinase
MRVEFDKHGLMMTAAVSAGQKTIDKAYDIPTMAETLDIISVMSYDYHGWWENHSFTGHNSPMYAIPEEADPLHPGYNFNTDWAIRYWLEKGAKKEQLLLGMGAYGRGFTLADPAKHNFYDPATNGIMAGPYTGTVGIWGYNEFCEKMYVNNEVDSWTKVRDPMVVAPYVYNNQYWLGYDDEYSIKVKSEYILEMGLAGGMVWSIDTDDFHGFTRRPRPSPPPPGTRPPWSPTTTATGPRDSSLTLRAVVSRR